MKKLLLASLIVCLCASPAGAWSLGGSVYTGGSNADSSETDTDSGLEKIGGKLTIIRGCADNQILKWDKTQDDWNCEADAGAAGGDSIEIDSVAVTDPDFVDTSTINVTDTTNTVTMDIIADSVDSVHYAADSIDEEHMAPNSVDSDSYVDNSIDNAHMSDNSIDSDDYVDGSIDAAHIAANAVEESHFKAVDAASDEECLTYESTTGDFEWQSCGAGAETNDLEGDGAANIADGEIFVGSGAGTGTYTNSLSIAAIDMGAGTQNIPELADCSGTTDEGRLCWETDADILWIGDGAAPVNVNGSGSGDITNVGECATGACTDDFINGTDLVDDAADSEHYTDGSVDNVHLATGIDGEKLSNDTVDDDSIDFGDVTCTDITMSDCGAITGTTGTFTGNLAGLTQITITTAATLDLTNAAACTTDMHLNGDADVIDYTLPPAAAGLNCCFSGGSFAGVITVDVDDGVDVIILDGTPGTAGHAVDSAGGAGDFLCLVAIDSTSWLSLGRSGTWVAGGAD